MPYELPSWMQAEAPSEPWKALLAGVQAGSGVASNILRSRAISEERRQFDIQQERAAQFDEIRKGIQAYQLEEAGLQVQKMKLAKDYEFQTSRAEVEIGNLLNTTDPRDPMFRSKLGGILARFPAASRSEVAKHAMELPFQAEKLDIERLKALPDFLQPTAETRNIESQVQREDRAHFLKTGQHLSEQAIADLAAKLGAPKNFSMKLDNSGNLTVAYGTGDPTVATESMVQKNLNIAEKNMQLLNELSTNLRGKDLGVRGNLGELVDRWAPQLGLPGFDKQRATNRESLKVAVQGMVRQISSDTERFSEGDRKRAEAAMVRPGWDENEQNARAVLDELRDIVRNRAKVDAQTGGMPIPEWSLSQDDIIDAVQSGSMTKEKAIELRLKYHRDKYGTPSTR